MRFALELRAQWLAFDPEDWLDFEWLTTALRYQGVVGEQGALVALWIASSCVSQGLATPGRVEANSAAPGARAFGGDAYVIPFDGALEVQLARLEDAVATTPFDSFQPYETALFTLTELGLAVARRFADLGYGSDETSPAGIELSRLALTP